MTLRETGSILVPSPPDRVQAALSRRMGEPVRPGRFESGDETVVLLETRGGTRVVVAKRQDGKPTSEARDRLRLAIEAELRAMREQLGTP